MTAYLIDWLSLLIRWFHVIAGIAWIGSSFYFIWLDNSLKEPPEWKKKKGIKGDLWSIHGGGIYEIAKYKLEPEQMPATLHWFKWEAYSTWLSGILLLSVVYYAQASTYMLGGSMASPMQAIASGIALIVFGVAIYEALLRTPLIKHGLLFGVVLTLVLTAISYLAMHLLSARAGMIHVGAVIGTIMAGNVFFGIMPAQRELVAAIEQNRQPDPVPAEFAKLRSTHNNYLTLPIIFCMIGNHYAFIYGHEFGWALLVAIGVISAYARHFFNLRHKGIFKPLILLQSAVAMVLLAGVITWSNQKALVDTTGTAVSDAEVMTIVEARCTVCHASVPTQTGFIAPPAGIILESVSDLLMHKDKVLQSSVITEYMPLGNMTEMTEEERAHLSAYLNQ